MKHFYLFLLFTVLTITCHSQRYPVDDNGQKTEVLIKNEDWLYNPVKFNYRISENGEIRTATIKHSKKTATLTNPI